MWIIAHLFVIFLLGALGIVGFYFEAVCFQANKPSQKFFVAGFASLIASTIVIVLLGCDIYQKLNL